MNDETISLVRDVAARLRQQAMFASNKSEVADYIAGAEAIESMLAELERRTVDDETLVDEAWLLSVGFDSEFSCLAIKGESKNCVAYLLTVMKFFVNGRGVNDVKTRGQVRRLCEALGIKLKDVV